MHPENDIPRPEDPSKKPKKRRVDGGGDDGGMDLDELSGCFGCLFAPFKLAFKAIFKILDVVFSGGDD